MEARSFSGWFAALLVTLVLLLPATAVRGDGNVWQCDPLVQGDWFDAQNWLPPGNPYFNDYYIVNNGGTAVLGGDAYGSFFVGSGSVLQTAGNVNAALDLCSSSADRASYTLAGGQFSGWINLAWQGGDAQFIQTAGQCSTNNMSIGNGGKVQQSGGSSTIGYLSIDQDGQYVFSGGSLQISDIYSSGTMDFSGQAASLNLADYSWNWIGGSLLNASQVACSAGANSVTVFLDGNAPSAFKNYTSAGTTLVGSRDLVDVPSGMTLELEGETPAHIRCAGTITGDSSFDHGVEVLPGGTVSLGSGWLQVNDLHSGISAGGELQAFFENIGSETEEGYFLQEGGVNSVVVDDGPPNQGSISVIRGTYEFRDGSIIAGGIFSGDRFIQTGGVATCDEVAVTKPYDSTAGTYELRGGTVLTQSVIVGQAGVGVFLHSGGDNQVSGDLTLGIKRYPWEDSRGEYDLSGTGTLTAKRELIGAGAEGVMNQSGGVNSTQYLHIGPEGHYLWSGGTLQVTGGLQIEGEFDFGNRPLSLNYTDAMVDLTGHLVNAGNVSINLQGQSLLILPATWDGGGLGSLTNAGMTHIAGTTLAVAAGQGFGGQGTISDFVDCRGTIAASPGAGFDLPGGLRMSEGGNADLGTATLNVIGDNSSISGGTLYVSQETIGSEEAAGQYTISGGENNVDTLTIMQGSVAQTAGVMRAGTLFMQGYGDCTYELSGTGEVAAQSVEIGRYWGQSRFVQAGGICRTDWLTVGSWTDIPASYELSGDSQLITSSESIGERGFGLFRQNGGTNSTDYLWLGDMGGGNYELNGGVLSVTQSLDVEFGTFSHTCGNNTTAAMNVGSEWDSAAASYELSGSGTLSAQSLTIACTSGSAVFVQTGGAANVSGATKVAAEQWSGLPAESRLSISGGRFTTGDLAIGTRDGGYYGDLRQGVLELGSQANVTVRGKFTLGEGATLRAEKGAVIRMAGASLENRSTDAAALSGLSNVTLLFEGNAAATAKLEIAGADLGATEQGFTGNFALDVLQIGGQEGTGTVQLVDAFQNQLDCADEALYVESLILGPGSRLDLNGQKLYCRSEFIDPAAILDLHGGTLTMVPEPATLSCLAAGALLLIRRPRKGCEAAG